MAKYIDAELLREEIERLKTENNNIKCIVNESYCVGYDDAFGDLLSIIDSLQQEQADEPDKSLEEEIKNYFQGYWPGTETAEQCNTDLHFTPLAILRLARHFAEWQKEQDDNLLNIAYMDGLQRGKEAEREQMMKDAVEGTMYEEPGGTTFLDCLISFPKGMFNHEEKIKIIVVKEDEK